LQAGSNIVLFKVIIVRKEFLVRHPSGQQFQDHCHWIPQPANARCTVANVCVNHDTWVVNHEMVLKEFEAKFAAAYYPEAS